MSIPFARILNILVVCLFMVAPAASYSQQQTPKTDTTQTTNSQGSTVQNTGSVADPITSTGKSANFLTTFVKYPFVLIAGAGTFMGCAWAGVFEFFANVFTLFDYGFPATKSIWNMGWNNIVVDWWWKPGVWWHLMITIIVFLGAGKGARR